jgi:hypothetical protein
MTRLLHAAGAPQLLLDIIPEIIETCRTCRAWAKPQPDSVASVRLAGEFNEIVELDIMYYRDFMIFHMIDRCTRWHAAKMCSLDDIDTRENRRTQETIVACLNDCWISIHGPMKELVADGEAGWAKSGLAHAYYERHGITLNVRAKEQHARFIERRGALLRHTLHLIEGQM